MTIQLTADWIILWTNKTMYSKDRFARPGILQTPLFIVTLKMHHNCSRPHRTRKHPCLPLLFLPSLIKINHKTRQHDKAQLHILSLHLPSNPSRFNKIAIAPFKKSALHQIHTHYLIRYKSYRIASSTAQIFYLFL